MVKIKQSSTLLNGSKYLSVLLGLLFCYTAHSQVNINIDSEIERTVNTYIQHNLSKEEILGYRIQIAAGTSRDKISKAQSSFRSKYVSQRTYLTYNSPYFKLRTGDFKDRLKAYRFLINVRRDFPSAFLVKDMVSVR